MADVEGFKTTKYPQLEGKDVDLYICKKCVPDWDTFDAQAAKEHTDAGVHNALGQPLVAPPPGQVMP